MERHYGSRQRRLTLLAICHCHEQVSGRTTQGDNSHSAAWAERDVLMFAPSGWLLKETEEKHSVYLWDLSHVSLRNELPSHDLDYRVCISRLKLMSKIVSRTEAV